jgi:hypothetical protein
MNEKIERIADEADLYADNYLSSRGEYHPDWHTVRDRKFAELIVKDCIKVVYDNVEVALDATGNVVFEDELLKKHFGVE